MKLFALAVLAAGCTFARPIHVKLDPNLTKITFTLGDVLHTVHGTFRLSEGDLWMDPATHKASGHMTVGASTGDSGSHARDTRMNKNVLQTSDFPEITFTPDHIEGTLNETGESTFKLHGLFGIHGATHELTMDVTSRIEASRATATANFEVPYVNWGMKDPSTFILRVNNTVQIKISAVGNTE